jgi:hypothetical protein
MNLCGVPESLETSNGSKVMPVSETHPPPSPLLLSIAPPEFQTPRSKGESLGMTATPSPALLNPLTNAFWNDSSSARGRILCPRLESAPFISEPFIQRLLSGFRVVSLYGKHVYFHYIISSSNKVPCLLTTENSRWFFSKCWSSC